MDGYTRFTKVEAEEFKGAFVGDVKGGVKGAADLTKSADYTLSAEEKASPAVAITMSAASKSVTLGLEEGQVMFVLNSGDTNAFTVKPKSGDTGVSVGAGKVALCVGGASANAGKVIVLN